MSRSIFPQAAVVAISGIVFFGAAGTTRAADAEPGAMVGCSAPEYRQLDFKIGEFDVTGIGGARAGESVVEAALQGCLLIEHWTGAISGKGRATMFYDRQQRKWHQLYVTDDGDIMRLSGQFDGAALVLLGQNDFDVFKGLHRMIWSPLPNGGVLQDWTISRDNGATWEKVHVGNYARRSAR